MLKMDWNNRFRQNLKNISNKKMIVVMAGLILLLMLPLMINIILPKIYAGDGETETAIKLESGFTGVYFISGSGTYRITSVDDTVYDIDIRCNYAGAKIILDNINVVQTTDKAAFSFASGEFELALEGNSSIESTYDGAMHPIIKVEESTTLDITKQTDDNGAARLNLTTGEHNYGAAIGGGSSYIKHKYAASAGTINIKGAIELNIITKGYGAAIGGAASDSEDIDGGSGGNVNIENGTITLVSTDNSYATLIGGGAAVDENGSTLGTALAGSGSDIAITGGSLYVETNGTGDSFGSGNGYTNSTITSGTLTDGKGNDVCLYIAQSYKNGIVDNQYPLKITTGDKEYSYTLLNKQTGFEDGSTFVKTDVVLLDDITHYTYSGNGHSKIGNGFPNSNLYFYLPASEIKYYNIVLEEPANGTISAINTVTESTKLARYGESVKVTANADKDYYIDSVYYTDEKGKIVYLSASEDGTYLFTMPTSDVCIGVSFVLPEYKITYLNDFNAKHNNPVKYTAKSEFALKAPVVEGYTFVEWLDENNNPVTGITKGTTGDKIFTAKWTKDVFTVLFMDYDNTLISIQTCEYGQLPTAPEDPVRNGYIFTGWDADLTVPITDNINITAQYKADETIPVPDPDEYYIRVDASVAHGTLTPDKTSAEADEIVNVTIVPDRGYRLYSLSCKKDSVSGYTASRNSVLPEFVDSTATLMLNSMDLEDTENAASDNVYSFEMPANNVLIFATFKEINYSITYMNSTDDNTNPTTYTINDEFVLGDIAKENYVFKGWYNSQGIKVTKIDKGTTGHIVLTAEFTATGAEPETESPTQAPTNENPDLPNEFDTTTDDNKPTDESKEDLTDESTDRPTDESTEDSTLESDDEKNSETMSDSTEVTKDSNQKEYEDDESTLSNGQIGDADFETSYNLDNDNMNNAQTGDYKGIMLLIILCIVSIIVMIIAFPKDRIY